jgi:hypothetical protein
LSVVVHCDGVFKKWWNGNIKLSDLQYFLYLEHLERGFFIALVGGGTEIFHPATNKYKKLRQKNNILNPKS